MSPIQQFTKAFPMILLIPGPVTTRAEVRAVMARDFAPWDNDFRVISRRIRARVREIAGAPEATHTALPLQGCGHFGTEAALRSVLPPGGRVLVPLTGTYADRMVRLAREAGRVAVPLVVDQNKATPPAQIVAALEADPTLSHVGLVYSETSSGVIHDAVAIGAAVRAIGRRVILDAVSAFGALPLNLAEQPEVDAAVFTTNKCLEGLPGLVFIIVRHAGLQPPGTAGSWSFDLSDLLVQTQRDGGGGFRFTPAAQVVASFDTALDFFAAEGGQPARLARYRENARTVWQGMADLGLRPCLDAADQGPIVVNIEAPPDPAWSLQGFVDLLKERGFTISNFFNTEQPSFRIGCIGDVSPQDMQRFVGNVDEVLIEMGVKIRRGN
jgi:2-aminoethylphosphonate-pyruvate transaminase